MNKTLRKSGGVALRKTPFHFEKYLRYVNQIALFVGDPEIKAPAYFELPTPPKMYDPQLIVDVFTPPMRELETVLRIISVDFALDILKSHYYFDSKSDEVLTEMLLNPAIPIFKPELGEYGTDVYLTCLRRYIGFHSLYYLMDDLVFNWRHKKDEAIAFFRDAIKPETFFNIKNRFSGWNEYISMSVKLEKGEFRIAIAMNEWLENLQDLEIDRVRKCKYCRKFYWAERSDKPNCADCSTSEGKNKAEKELAMREKARNVRNAERLRNLQIKSQVEAQPIFTPPSPEVEEVEYQRKEFKVGELIFNNDEVYVVTELRDRHIVLLPVPKLGLFRRSAKKIKEYFFGN